MANQPKTPSRTVRIDDETWLRLGVAVEARNRGGGVPVTRSSVIRDGIVEFCDKVLGRSK